MINKFRAYIEENKLICQNDKILIGVSGGKDSVTLFDLFLKIRNEYNLEIEVAHLNHMVRGDDAVGDLDFVRKLCLENTIVFHGLSKDMNAYAKELKISKEEAGRKLRFDFFNSIISEKEEAGLWKIALAHNMDDQAETVLMRIIRGTGIRGLCGISPKKDNIIRPLLGFFRSEIESYVRDEKLAFRQDTSNFENDYTRNRIRNILIPKIENDYNINFKEALVRLGSLALGQVRLSEKYIGDLISQSLVKEDRHSFVFSKKNLLHYEENEQTAIMRFCIEKLHDSLDSYEKVHFDEFLKVLKGKSANSMTINGTICYNSFDNFVISSICTNDLDRDFIIDKSEGFYKFNGYKIKVEESDFKEDESALYIPMEKLGRIKIRKRLKGDRIYLKGRYVKLKDFLINKKVDLYKRDFLPIIEVDDQILMVADLYKNRQDMRDNKYIKILMEE